MNILHVNDLDFKRKISKMTSAQLHHTMQQLNEQMVTYARNIANYPPERMEKYGMPYMNNITARIELVKALLPEYQAK